MINNAIRDGKFDGKIRLLIIVISAWSSEGYSLANVVHRLLFILTKINIDILPSLLTVEYVSMLFKSLTLNIRNDPIVY